MLFRSGQPLAMTVGLNVLETVNAPDFLNNINERSTQIKDAFKKLSENFPIQNIRGKGLLLAFDLPNENAQNLAKHCLEEGLIINAPSPKTVRVIPPLIVGKKHISEMIRILKKALTQL